LNFYERKVQKMAKYTDEKHAQIVLALLKAHGIQKVVASPGTTNIPIVGSMQYDNWFEMYSSVDERSAAYMACGLAEESGEPVVLSCTGATASRNYLPGLTEAYYRKLPVIAITSFNGERYIGNLMPQTLDRSHPQNDVCKISVQLPIVKDEKDFAYCEQLVNNALLESKRHGSGPVHINLTTNYLGTFDTETLPQVRIMRRFTVYDELPALEANKIAIFVGSKRFTQDEEDMVSLFAQKTGAAVMCGHSGNYYGANRFDACLTGAYLYQYLRGNEEYIPDLVIHIGEITEAYKMYIYAEKCKELWRVSEDGELRDTWGKLTNVFEMPIYMFFQAYGSDGENEPNKYYEQLLELDKKLRSTIPELPFSNAWLAKVSHNQVPENSKIFLGILNTVRTWGLFPLKTKNRSVNSGGFGIDGIISTAVGSSLVNKEKLHFVILGDLAFFYDMNVLGNRHVSANIRILLVNNKRGSEFRLYTHLARVLGQKADDFVAANGHYINHFDEGIVKSTAESWATALGWKYLSATTKDEYLNNMNLFFTETSCDRPMLFEVFTTPEDESDGLKGMFTLGMSNSDKLVKQFYTTAKRILPKSLKIKIKKVFH
jgi:2-succinyl-5-enolpyruvyl-6-hydroxy-3-cyclohexene-1-carboxylate synthase